MQNALVITKAEVLVAFMSAEGMEETMFSGAQGQQREPGGWGS